MQNQDAIAILKAKIAANASRRIRDDVQEISRPKILHTQYLGDRTVQQLGQEPIENAVILNNSANAIGDALMPLAKGQPLQRFDSVNQDDNFGSARRSLLERDAIANGQSTFNRGNGEETPVNNPIIGTPRGRDPLPQDYPPPFGCVPLFPAKQCIWIPQPTSPSGYQSHGSAVINQDGLELFLHCQDGVVPPEGLGCDFLSRWKCIDGICYQSADGIYDSKAECEANLIRTYYVVITGVYLDNFGEFQPDGAVSKIVSEPNLTLSEDGVAGVANSGELAYWYKIGTERFTEAGWRLGAVSIAIYRLNSSTCP